RKLRQELADRVVQQEVAFLVEHHYRDHRDGLCHREDAEDRVALYGLAGLDVHQADGFEVAHFAVARDEGDRAGDLPLTDGALHGFIDPPEACRREPDGLRRDLLERHRLHPPAPSPGTRPAPPAASNQDWNTWRSAAPLAL